MSKLNMILDIANWDHRYPKFKGSDWLISHIRALAKLSKAEITTLYHAKFDVEGAEE
jgi:hypothetical protein